MFDLDQFMNQTVDGAMATEFPVHPEGEFVFLLDSDPKMLEVKHITGTGDKGPYDFHQMEILCISQDEKVKQDMGRDKIVVRAQVGLDFDLSGRLSTEKGKNVLLGQLREALGQNAGPWSPKMLLGGGPVIGRVKQREGKDGKKYADVVAFAKMK